MILGAAGYSLIRNRWTRAGAPIGGPGVFSSCYSLPFVQSSFGKSRYCWPWPNGRTPSSLDLRILGDARIVDPKLYRDFLCINGVKCACDLYPGSFFSPSPFFLKRTAKPSCISIPYPGVIILRRDIFDELTRNLAGYTFAYVDCEENGFVQLCPEKIGMTTATTKLPIGDGCFVDFSTKELKMQCFETLLHEARGNCAACFASFGTGLCFVANEVVDVLFGLCGCDRENYQIIDSEKYVRGMQMT